MPRILGIDIPNNKRINISLRYIYGIGPHIADEICKKAEIDPSTKAGDLTEANIAAILQILQDEYTVEGDLRRQVAQTNARTRKGGKKTVGAIRDRSERKQAAKK